MIESQSLGVFVVNVVVLLVLLVIIVRKFVIIQWLLERERVLDP